MLFSATVTQTSQTDRRETSTTSFARDILIVISLITLTAQIKTQRDKITTPSIISAMSEGCLYRAHTNKHCDYSLIPHSPQLQFLFSALCSQTCSVLGRGWGGWGVSACTDPCGGWKDLSACYHLILCMCGTGAVRPADTVTLKIHPWKTPNGEAGSG